MSSLYKSFLKSLPKSRSELVNELEIPDDIIVSPVTWTETESDSLTSDSFSSESISVEFDKATVSSDSSLALSRAMTDSEIDYGRYKRLINRKHSNPWDEMQSVLSRFPPEYLASIISMPSSSSEPSSEEYKRKSPYLSEEFKEQVERFLENECRVFEADDPGLLELRDVLANIHAVDLEDCGAKF